MTDVQKIAFDTLKAGAPGLSDQTREVLAGIIARKVALSTTPGQADDKSTLAAVAKALFEGDTALAIRLAKQSKCDTTPARAEAQDGGAVGRVNSDISPLLDHHRLGIDREDLPRPSPTPAAQDDDRVRIAVEALEEAQDRINVTRGPMGSFYRAESSAEALYEAKIAVGLALAALKSTAAKEGEK